jgi:hypothetical protein
MENNTTPQQTEEQSTQTTEQIDIDSLSDEELDAYIENFDENQGQFNSTKTSEDPQGDNQPTQKEDNIPDQQGGSDNESNPEPQVNDDEPYIPDGFDVETFNSIPDNYKKLFQPIKANGTQIQPDPDKMIQLVQLGSKYYADREKVKPKLELVNMLEKAGVNDKEKLTLALDIVNGDKEALSKFLKDNEIDPIDLDLEENQYNPDINKYYNPTESKLKEVESQLEGSKFYDAITKTVASIDEKSQETLLREPEKLLAINAHMETGLYDQIIQKMSEEKMFGVGLNESFIEKYERIGLELIQGGNANQQPQQQPNQTNKQEPTKQVQQQTQVQQQPNEQVPNSIIAGGSNEGNAPKKKVIDLNDPNIIDNLSEEELEKLLN